MPAYFTQFVLALFNTQAGIADIYAIRQWFSAAARLPPSPLMASMFVGVANWLVYYDNMVSRRLSGFPPHLCF